VELSRHFPVFLGIVHCYTVILDGISGAINYGYATREVMHHKYIAANIFTIEPFKRLYISLGNSVVYSDVGVHAAYLIPVMFYKSIDHTLNGTSNYSGQNAQMYFDISSRQIKYLHVYADDERAT